MKLEKRAAQLTDLAFIQSCILYGARKGHYSLDADNPVMVRQMRAEMQAIISQQHLLDHRSASAYIYTLNNRRVACLLLSASSLENDGIEIYALSVARAFQGQGYGSQILDQVLDEYCYSDIYARCASSSKKMNRLLEKRDFRLISASNQFRILLRACPLMQTA